MVPKQNAPKNNLVIIITLNSTHISIGVTMSIPKICIRYQVTGF